MTSVVIAGYARSPFTLAHKGALARVRPDELAAQVVRALVARTGVNPKEIEDLILGCAFPEGEQGFNLARLVVFLAELPLSVGGVTVNRFCGSSMQAIHMAAGNIKMGAGEAFICAGVESMTRVPMTGFNPLPHPALYEKWPGAYMGMGETAENVAKKYNFTRAEQDSFAMTSQKKAAEAQRKGRLTDEIVPIKEGKKVIDRDGCLRPNTTLKALNDLNPAFDENGTVTAGTSSPLTDGAAATLVTSEAFAKKHGLQMLARINTFALSGCAPEIMGIGPVEATRKALDRAGLTVEDMDIIELNEAFASQSLAVIRDLGLDVTKINQDGGAIALGHPLGATGARITGKAALLLHQDKKARYALATQCIGGGQGIATILERL
jgi:acetyl-CoA acyltransferase